MRRRLRGAGERGGALPPRSSVCPVNRAISCFNKHIYWEYFRFSVVSQGALSQRAVGQSQVGNWHHGRQTVPKKGDPATGASERERVVRRCLAKRGSRKGRSCRCKGRADEKQPRRGNGWLGGAWRREDPGRDDPVAVKEGQTKSNPR